MNYCIFTAYNYQINSKVINSHNEVISNMIRGTGIQFVPLRYNLPRKYISQYQAVDYGLKNLFSRYENILILDVDCIPLSKESLFYTMNSISNNVLIGCARRSMNIQNGNHIYVSSSCLGISRNLFFEINNPSFAPTERGGEAEEITYLTEEGGMPIEFFMPSYYESEPTDGSIWQLSSNDQRYGIGTTFIHESGKEMFYHLFESRKKIHDFRFLNKSLEVLNGISNTI